MRSECLVVCRRQSSGVSTKLRGQQRQLNVLTQHQCQNEFCCECVCMHMCVSARPQARMCSLNVPLPLESVMTAHAACKVAGKA